MTEDSTFTMDLIPAQVHGTELIQISKIIPQQNLRITGYTITTIATPQSGLLGGLYINCEELNNVGYLMDNNPSLNSLILETTDDATQTFISNCYKIFKMNRDLDHSFYINCFYKTATGTFVKVDATNFPDIRVRVVFVLQRV